MEKSLEDARVEANWLVETASKVARAYYVLAKGSEENSEDAQKGSFVERFSNRFAKTYREGNRTEGVEVSEKEVELVENLVTALIRCGESQYDRQQRYGTPKDPELIQRVENAYVIGELYSVLNAYDEAFRRSSFSRAVFPPTSRWVGGLPKEVIARAFTEVILFGDEARKKLDRGVSQREIAEEIAKGFPSN